MAAELYGGAGSDLLVGGGGTSILVGGDGNDMLLGGTGRNLMIGGLGSDRMIGGRSDDILIGGSTVFDANSIALRSLMAEWNSSDTYATRIAYLGGKAGGQNGGYFLNSATVADDNSVDTLTGAAGQDWFFAHVHGAGALDKITDASASETTSS